MDSSPEAYGAASHIPGWCPLFLTPKEPFCACAVSPFPQGWEICDLLILSSNKGLAPLCSCHKSVPCPVIYPIPVVSYIEVQIPKYRSLVINMYSGAHLSLASGNVNGPGNECPAWSPSSSHPRKCEQEASCKCLAWGPPISCLIPCRGEILEHYTERVVLVGQKFMSIRPCGFASCQGEKKILTGTGTRFPNLLLQFPESRTDPPPVL